MMAKFLELSDFLDKNRMPRMEVRGGGVKTCLYTKRPSCFKALFKFSQKLFFRDEFCCPSFDDGKLRCNIHHNATFTLSIASALPEFEVATKDIVLPGGLGFLASKSH